MEFYSSIADVYDYVFPLKAMQVDFIGKSLHAEKAQILDIGCATGSLAIELARLGHSVTGIDFDKKMIEKAEEKAAAEGLTITFMQMDMRKIPDHFTPKQFDLVLCCGNTLVHLTDPADIRHFLAQTAVLLNEGGVFLLQIINYDRILDKGISGLPTIENDRIRFERYYNYDSSSGLIDFTTILTIKDSRQKIENTIPLYPIRKSELIDLLHPAGFRKIVTYGGFDRSSSTSDSIPLIVKAEV